MLRIEMIFVILMVAKYLQIVQMVNLEILQGLADAKWLDNPNHRYPDDCPPNCGDGYCDTDAGEDATNCRADCP